MQVVAVNNRRDWKLWSQEQMINILKASLVNFSFFRGDGWGGGVVEDENEICYQSRAV